MQYGRTLQVVTLTLILSVAVSGRHDAQAADANLAEQVVLARQDLKAPGGTGYDQAAGTAIQQSLASAMRACMTPASSTLPFDLVYTIDASGAPLHVVGTPGSVVANCVIGKLGPVHLPKPPFDPFHLLIEITITPPTR